MMRTCCITTVLCFILGVSPAWGHRVVMGAWLEGDTLVAEVGFGDGSSAAGAKMLVQDKASGEILLQGEADEEGVYEVSVPAEIFARGQDLLVVADAGSGHRAEATIEVAEFPGSGQAESETQEPATSEMAELQEIVVGEGLDETALRALVQEAVRTEVRPLRREIEALSERKPGPTEVIGGIGYLLGLAGLVALIKRPKRDG